MLKKLIGLSIITLFFVVMLNAQSQRPVPSTRILSSQEKQRTADNKANSQNYQRGTEQSPVIIKIAPTQNTQEEATQSKKEKDERAAMERRSEITTRFIAGATIIQAVALMITIIIMVWATMRQLRAYLAVDLFTVIRQEDATETKYEVRFFVRNVGKTPAYKVTFNAHSDILPFPLSNDFIYPLPPAPHIGESTIFPNQQFIINTFLDRLLTDEEIIAINNATAQRLYAYGTITYKDTFHRSRYTNFCQNIAWLRNGTPVGNYTKKHNEAN